MITLKVLRHFVENYDTVAYILIWLGVIIEGEIIVIFAGIFSHLGSLNFFLCLLFTILGCITKSFLAYYIGQTLKSKYQDHSFPKRIENRINYFFPKFKTNPFFSILISRFFVLGLNWFTLIFAGYSGVNKKTYLKAEIISLLVWSVGVLSLGYFFSYTALSVSRDVRKFLGIILICFIVFFILQKIIALIIDIISDKYRT